MYEFGGCSANHLKAAIYDAFKKFGFNFESSEEDARKLVSMCADGASVNMGIYNGALALIQLDIPWLIKIHCALHCLELAVKDACESYPHFTTVNDMMTSIYTMFKNSGNCTHLYSIIMIVARIIIMVTIYFYLLS